jgi:hypothetical protein
MLSRDCRRFREEFTPGPGGSQDPHRQACPACAAYAAAVERAASAPRLPLPERLRSSLRALPRPDEPRLPMPQAQLPAALKDRLRNIPRDVRSGGRRELPVWIRSPRWAIAASYFLTVVLLNTVGDPVALGRRATGTLVRTLDQTWDQTWTQTWGQIREERLPRIESAIAERYGTAVGSLETTLESSLTTLRSEAREITDQTRRSFDKLIDKENP